MYYSTDKGILTAGDIMHFKGNFEPSSLVSILQLLNNDEKTGLLRLTNGQNEVKIFFKNGSIVYAAGAKKKNHLGFILRNKGIISNKQLKEALMLSNQKKQALGKTLVEKEYISAKQAVEVVQEQAQEVLFDLFFWEKGYFEYNDAKINLKGLVTVHLDIMAIILEATRRIDEMSILKKRIPNDGLIFKKSDSNNVPRNKEIKFNADEWRIFELIDGLRTVRELINKVGYDDFAAYKILNSLISFGVIEQCKEALFEDTKKNENLLPVLKIYYGILHFICKKLEKELGKWAFTITDKSSNNPIQITNDKIRYLHKKELDKWTSTIIDKCIPDLSPKQKELFEIFNIQSNVDKNIDEVQKYLKVLKNKNIDREHIFIKESLNQFLLNILNKAKNILGLTPTWYILEEAEKNLSYICEKNPELDEKTDIIDEIKSIFTQTREQTRDNKSDSRQNAYGIFSVSNTAENA